MKILVVCQYYCPEPFRITDICESLVNKGHDVTVLTGLPNYPEGRVLDEYRRGKRRKETQNGVKIIRTFVIGRGHGHIKLFLNYFSFPISASLKAFFVRETYDVVFVYQLSPVMMATPAIVYKKKHNKKMLLYCLDLWPDSLAAGGIKEGSFIYKLFFKISKRIYKRADMILVGSNMFRDYLETNFGLNIPQERHLPQYAEDIFVKTTGLLEINDSDNALSDENKQFNFVFAGNIGDMQSVDTIVMTADKLRDHNNITFHIVGDGSKMEENKQLSNDLGLSNIIFYGRRAIEEMPHFYRMADAMLITLKDNKTLSYTLPGKMQSYLAAGKPIIGSINGEAARVIEESQCGLCCNAEDSDGLSDLILQFCRSESKAQMVKNARKYYFDNYDKDQFIIKLEKALLTLCETNRASLLAEEKIGKDN